MIHDPPPVCRCPRCGGRMVRREFEPDEWPVTRAAECLHCGWDMELIDGYWKPITRPAGSPAPWPLPAYAVTVPPSRRGRPRKVKVEAS